MAKAAAVWKVTIERRALAGPSVGPWLTGQRPTPVPKIRLCGGGYRFLLRHRRAYTARIDSD